MAQEFEISSSTHCENVRRKPRRRSPAARSRRLFPQASWCRLQWSASLNHGARVGFLALRPGVCSQAQPGLHNPRQKCLLRFSDQLPSAARAAAAAARASTEVARRRRLQGRHPSPQGPRRRRRRSRPRSALAKASLNVVRKRTARRPGQSSHGDSPTRNRTRTRLTQTRDAGLEEG